MIDRYTRPEMGQIWSSENKFTQMLAVEKMVAHVQADKGLIPREAAEAIKKLGRFDLARILELEKTTRHDVIAFVSNVAENVGPLGRFVHFGLTSSDVIDTALSLQVAAAGKLLLSVVDTLIATLTKRIEQEALTLCSGRTHGMHAEPTTFGMKLAGHWAEFKRVRSRLDRAVEQMKICKLSGAVGAHSALGSSSNESADIEKSVATRLGLVPETVATQVVPRDRHAELMGALALIGCACERLAVELRHLQRTEVGEVLEGFQAGQKGSSAMPHKKNPISAENITGCARLLRSYHQAALEDVALWHERDISHSAVERVIFPDAFILADYACDRLNKLVYDLQIDRERMRANMQLSQGQLFSSHLLLALVEKGLSREQAYALVQSLSHRLEKGQSLSDQAKKSTEVTNILSPNEIDHVFSGLRHQAGIVQNLKRLGFAVEESFADKNNIATFQKGELLYEGKAKRIYQVVSHPDLIWQEFKDSLTAFNALKKGSFAGKGHINRDVTSLVFRFMQSRGVPTHWVCDIGDDVQVTKKLDMLKLEVVVRNILAGSTAKKLGFAEGTLLEKPLVEFYYKDDALADPFVSDEQALMLKTVQSVEELNDIRALALKINAHLTLFFSEVGLKLVDFKIELGRSSAHAAWMLADEITPDSCRLWDKVTNEKMDKDRFRRDLGGVQEAYEKVCQQLKQKWDALLRR